MFNIIHTLHGVFYVIHTLKCNMSYSLYTVFYVIHTIHRVFYAIHTLNRVFYPFLENKLYRYMKIKLIYLFYLTNINEYRMASYQNMYNCKSLWKDLIFANDL